MELVMWILKSSQEFKQFEIFASCKLKTILMAIKTINNYFGFGTSNFDELFDNSNLTTLFGNQQV